MSRCDPAQSRMSRTARFISRRMSTFRYFDECYSAQVKTIDSRRAFNEGERERNCFFEKKTRKRNDCFMLTMNDKVHNLLIYRCFNQKWKNILEIFCIKIYSIIVFQNNGGVFKICNKSRIFYPFFIKLPPNDTKYLFIRVIIRKLSKMNLSSFR